MRDWQAEKTYAVFSYPANKKLASEIESRGASVVLFPTIKLQIVELNDNAENLLKDASAFDWIIFPDVFAADYFLQILEQLEIDFYELDAVRVCVFGETVADRLRYAQVHADVVSIEANQVFQALRDYEPDLSGKRCMIPQQKNSNLEIAAQLKQERAEIFELPIYEAQINDVSVLPKLKAFLKGGAIDEFVFCSPSEIAALAILFRPEKPVELLVDTKISATDAATFQSLREFGFTKIKIR